MVSGLRQFPVVVRPYGDGGYRSALGGPWAVGTPDCSAVLLTTARESTVIPKSLI